MPAVGIEPTPPDPFLTTVRPPGVRAVAYHHFKEKRAKPTALTWYATN